MSYLSLSLDITCVQCLNLQGSGLFVSFFPDCCVFQDISTGKAKGIGRVEHELYRDGLIDYKSCAEKLVHGAASGILL